MEHENGLPFLKETILFLTLAGILIPLLQRYRINQILAFLCIGIIFGPFGISLYAIDITWLKHFTFESSDNLKPLAELGVMFLMFLIGLELSIERLWNLRRWVFVGGTTQISITASILGFLAYFFGNSVAVSLVLGLLFALSSTAIAIQVLSQNRQLAQPMGQASFSILMMQDFAVVPLLILVDLLAAKSSENLLNVLVLTLIKSAVAILIIYVLGRKITAPIFRYFAQKRQPEVFVALTLLATLGISALTAAAGLSLALGAFLAGLLLAETEYRHEVEITVEPFKGLLMGLFFMTVGMGIDVHALVNNFMWICLSVLGLILIKAAVISIILHVGKLSMGKAIEGGLLLSQGGEFAFVILGVASHNGLMNASISNFMMLVVSISLLVTPITAKLGQHIGSKIDSRGHQDQGHENDLIAGDRSGHIVIAGYGRVGQLIGEILEKRAVHFLALEHDANIVAKLHKIGKPVFYGNAAKPELLRKLNMEQAAALIITMDQPNAAMHTVMVARKEYPDLPIYVRSRDEKHAQDLRRAGATSVVPETLEAGLQLSFFALDSLSLPVEEITKLIEDEREIRVSRH